MFIYNKVNLLSRMEKSVPKQEVSMEVKELYRKLQNLKILAPELDEGFNVVARKYAERLNTSYNSKGIITPSQLVSSFNDEFYSLEETLGGSSKMVGIVEKIASKNFYNGVIMAFAKSGKGYMGNDSFQPLYDIINKKANESKKN